MKISALITFIFLQLFAMNVATYAQNIDCGQEYTVRSGDTLEAIAKRAYGRSSAFQLLFNRNRDKIDRLDLIRPNQKLWIPCPTPAPPERKVEEDFEPVEAVQLEILTASDYAPFTDERSPQRGMLTELVEAAFEEANSQKLASRETEFRIDFINDWAKHLTILLPLRKYDIGFPWYKPDCSRIEKLGPRSALRCEKFYFSDVLYEVVVSYYSLRNKRLDLRTADDLKGKTLCRPAGYFTFDLELRDLTPPAVSLLQPDRLGDCFEKLLNGEADVVTMNTLIVDSVVKRDRLDGKLQQHPGLATIETLHAIVLKTHPAAQSLLLRINRGLDSLKSSGKYDKIVERHLSPLVN